MKGVWGNGLYSFWIYLEAVEDVVKCRLVVFDVVFGRAFD